MLIEPIQLGRGLVAVTGETGTGKSLISSAFSLAAGARVRGADLVGSRGSTAAVQLQLELAEGHRASTAEVSTGWARRLRSSVLEITCSLGLEQSLVLCVPPADKRIVRNDSPRCSQRLRRRPRKKRWTLTAIPRAPKTVLLRLEYPLSSVEGMETRNHSP